MWKTILSTFLLVFVAELGDKTQLSTMFLASKSNSIWYVFIGSACALVLSSLLGVFAGSLIHKYIPIYYIQFFSGAAFIVIGIFLLLGKI
ncbi:MAG: TMEM165/GDT1 family protein [Bacillota bacterium]|nr:TMEM165/GDT1 family protein [Bacillota bacterium]